MDFWYESSHEQLILLAVSQTSCTTGSSCTITTFSARRTSDLVVTIVRITATRGAGVGGLPAGGELGAAALGGDGEAVGGRPAPPAPGTWPGQGRLGEGCGAQMRGAGLLHF